MGWRNITNATNVPACRWSKYLPRATADTEKHQAHSFPENSSASAAIGAPWCAFPARALPPARRQRISGPRLGRLCGQRKDGARIVNRVAFEEWLLGEYKA
jgi:hypothetical protein